MEVFGKFTNSGADVFRTEAYIDLNPKYSNGTYTIPADGKKTTKEIVGTIFMLNPGASVPKGYNLKATNGQLINMFQSFGHYVELEKDRTMKSLIAALAQCKWETDGLVEIRNLFNYRDASSRNLSGLYSQWDCLCMNNNILQSVASRASSGPCDLFSTHSLRGEFVFFAWGPTAIHNLRKYNCLTSYWKNILMHAQGLENQGKLKICYVKKKGTQEKDGKFFHPLPRMKRTGFVAQVIAALCSKAKLSF